MSSIQKKILLNSISLKGSIGFVMNCFQSVFADAFFGLLYLIVFDFMLKYKLPIPVVIFLLFFVAFYFIFAIPLWGKWMESCVNTYRANLSKAIFNSHINKRSQIFEHSASVLAVLQQDVDTASEILGWSLVTLFQAILSGVLSAIAIAVVSWKLLLLLLAVSVIPLIINLLCVSTVRNLSKNLRELVETKHRQILDLVNNIIIVKVFQQDEIVYQNVKSTAQKIYDKNMKLSKLDKLADVFGEFIYAIVFKLIIILYGTKLLLKGEIGFGSILFTLSMVEGIIFFTSYIGGYIKNFQKIRIGIKKLDSCLNTKIKDESDKRIYEIEENISDILVKHMSYQYLDSKIPIFKNLNVHFKFPNNYIISGKNGTGKSTLLKLIFGYDKLKEGSIEIKYDSMTNSCGKACYVPQQTFIISGTLRELMQNGNPRISDKTIVEALECVGLLEWYNTLDEKLNFDVAEKGKNLSKGQQMRIGIARAVAAKPQILFLDEPDANLDVDTMKYLMDNIQTKYSASVVMISHLEHHYLNNKPNWNRINLDAITSAAEISV